MFPLFELFVLFFWFITTFAGIGALCGCTMNHIKVGFALLGFGVICGLLGGLLSSSWFFILPVLSVVAVAFLAWYGRTTSTKRSIYKEMRRDAGFSTWQLLGVVALIGLVLLVGVNSIMPTKKVPPAGISTNTPVTRAELSRDSRVYVMTVDGQRILVAESDNGIAISRLEGVK